MIGSNEVISSLLSLGYKSIQDSPSDLAYTEMYFTEILWPDFNSDAFRDALISFTNRQRRFGQTGEQVEQAKGA